MAFPLFLVLIVGAFAAVFYYTWQANQKRREGLHMWALKHGFTYSAEDAMALSKTYDFDLFGKGEKRGCENVLVGQWQGVPVIEADYWYYTTSRSQNGGESRDYERFSIVIAEIAAFLPRVRAERENVLTRLADHVGLPDIAFESDDFNRRFNVKASDREFAFKLVDARMMHWLLGAPHKVCFEVNGTHLLLWSGRLDHARMPALLDTAKGFVDHVPKLVWTEYGKAAS